MTVSGPPSIAIPSRRDGTAARLAAVGACGCAVAIAAGVAAASGRGVLLLGAIAALAAGAFTISVYVRDPVRALIGFWLVVVLAEPLSTLAGGPDSAGGQAVRRGDEVVAVLLILLTVWRALADDIRVPLRFLLPAVGVAVCGVLGDVLNHVPLGIAAPGMWLGLKFWLMVAVAAALPFKASDVPRVYTVLMRVGAVVAIYGFADFATGNAISRALHLEAFTPALGAPRSQSAHSIFSGPNEYSIFMSILFALAFSRFASKRDRHDLLLAALFAVSVLLTLRLKGFLSLIAVVAIVTVVYRWASDRRRTLAVVAAGAALCGGVYALEARVIAGQVSLYTSSDQTARAQLYLTGERIALDDFPLGVGFGRFASYPSRYSYSPVYYEYGLSSVWGLGPDNPNFIDDTTWPAVVGETGGAGLAIYAVGLVVLALALIRRVRRAAPEMRWVPLAALCSLGVLLVDSLGDPTFFDWIPAAGFGLIFGLALAVTRSAPTGRASSWRRNLKTEGTML